MPSAVSAAIRLGTAALMLPAMLLIQAGLQRASGSPTKQAILFHAVSVQDQRSARHMLEDGVNVDIRDEMGSTPLHYCALRGDVDMAKFLLESGAEVDAANNLGMTALMFAANGDHPETMRVLIAAGADPLKKSRTSNQTALETAELNNAKSAVQVLKEWTTNQQANADFEGF